jgi:hypothetical protein
MISKGKKLRLDYTFSVERSVLKFLGIKRMRYYLNFGSIAGEPDAIDYDNKKVIEIKTTRLNVESYSSPVIEILQKGSLQVLLYASLVVLKGCLDFAIPSLIIAHFDLVDESRAIVTKVYEFRPIYRDSDVITKEVAQKIAREYFIS